MSTATAQVLIPIDFSEQSLIALEHSHTLAKFYNADLTLLHVIEEGGLFNKFKKKGTDDDTQKKEFMLKLEGLGADMRKKRAVNTNSMVVKGNVHDQILKTADAIGAKLIIMGSFDAEKNGIGSNALNVVKSAKCPVLTVKGKNVREGCKNIVLPIDMSKESREKVKNAIELGKLYGATVHIVTIVYPPDKDSEFRVRKQVDHVQKFIAAAGVACTTELVSILQGSEKLAASIINHANKMDADLLLIMTQQEDGMRALVGPTALDIINNSDVPVMSIVPTPKRAGGFSPY